MPMTSLGDFLVTNYLNDPTFYGSQLLYDPATEDPYGNPAVRERIFNALQGTPQTQAEVQAIQAPESTWQMSGAGYNAGLNIPDAPDRNDGDFGDIMKFMAIAGGLSGVGNMLAGNFGSAAGLGGFDAFTAADMAAGDAMLGGMGQDYGSFLNSLGGASGASVTPSLPSAPSTSMPLQDPFGAGQPGLLESTATPSVSTPVTTSVTPTGVASPVAGGTTTMPLTDPFGAGSSAWWENMSLPDIGSNVADVVAPVTAANTGNAAWDAILNSPVSAAGGGSFLSNLISRVPSLFNGQGGGGNGSGGLSGSALGGLLGALTASMGGARQTGTQTTIQDIPDWQKPYVTQAMQGAQTAYQNSTPSSLLAPAEQQMLQTIQGNYLNPASNPYLRDTFDQAAKAMSDSYLTTTQPRTDSLFGRSGQAFGGNSGYQETVARNQLGFGQNLKNLATDIYGGNYTRERQNQVGATQNAPGFATNQVGANFAPVNNYATIAGQRTGSQTSTPLYENRAGQALYGGLLGSQIFR